MSPFDFDGRPYLFEAEFTDEELNLKSGPPTSLRDLVTNSSEQMTGLRNALRAVFRDLHYQSKPVSGENKDLEGNHLTGVLSELFTYYKQNSSTNHAGTCFTH